jgi:hypothetical protein
MNSAAYLTFNYDRDALLLMSATDCNFLILRLLKHSVSNRQSIIRHR